MGIAQSLLHADARSSATDVPATGFTHQTQSGSRDDTPELATCGSALFAVLTVLWLGSAIVRFAAALLVTSPSIFTDELTYWSLARSFHHGAHFFAYNNPYDIPAQLYSILLSPLFGTGSSTIVYIFAKLLSSLMLCAVVFPAYFLAREIVNHREALAVAILSLLVPGGIYTATVMAENLFYPVLVLCAWLAFRTLLRGKVRDALWSGVAFSVGYYVKPHILFLMAGYAVCIGIWFISQLLPWDPAKRTLPTASAGAARRCIPFVVFACGLTVRAWETAGRAHSIVGMITGEAYAGVIKTGNYRLPWDLFAHSAAWLILVLAISTALLPLVAVMIGAFQLPKFDQTQRWFWIFLLCVCGTFLFMITRHNVLNDGLLRTHERYVFELSPLLFAWYFASRDKLPRRLLLPITAALVVGVASVLAYVSPHLLTWSVQCDSPTLSGLFWMLLRSPWHHARAFILTTLLVGGSICLLGSLFRRRLPILVLCWAAVLIACNLGWYTLRLKLVTPEVKRFNEIAMFVQAEVSRYDAVGFLEDNADPRVGWYGAFWWPGPYRYYYRERQPNTDWFAVPVKSRPDGSLEFGTENPRVLLASDSIELPYPVVHYFADAHMRMYRLGDPTETK
jgi:hypothetical protein